MYQPNPIFGDEILKLEGEDRIVTQFVDDEIRVRCGNRTVDVTRKIVLSFNAHDAVVDALTLALPYVETALEDQGYKPGFVARMTKTMRAALDLAEGRANSQA